MSTKTCTKCGVEKPVELFRKPQKDKEWRLAKCNECLAEENAERYAKKKAEIASGSVSKTSCEKCGSSEFYSNGKCKPCRLATNAAWRKKNEGYFKKYYSENKEFLLEQQREYVEKNKDAVKERRSNYYQSHKMESAERSKAYYEANKEKIADYNKKYREDNADELKIKKKQYREANKDLIRSKSAAFRYANKDRIRNKKRQSYIANKESILAAQKAYYQRNKEKIKLTCQQWRLRNKDRIRDTLSRYAKNNREAILARKKKYYQENKWRHKAHSMNRKRRIRKQGTKLSPDIVPKLMRLQKGLCPCCKEPLGKSYHIDHIMPIALGGSNTDNNVQLLRAECNLRKHAKHPIDYMQSKGFLL
jgi:hypothetical protein